MSGPIDTINRWWATLEEGKLDELAALTAPDAEIVMPGGLNLRGPAELRPVLAAYLAAFPDMHHEIVSSVEAADGVAVELRITMTHTGTFTTPMGDITPTGNRVVLDSCDVVRFGPDGRISSWHSYFDQAGLAAQLAPAAADVQG